jgi:hypothetical protein
MSDCPFSVGDTVRFTPSERTKGHYQGITQFGIAPDEEKKITRIKDNLYLYFDENAGGWPWNEFTLVQKASNSFQS